MKKNIIEIDNLTVAYHDEPVLLHNTLNIVDNSRTAIIGPNGAGKSTLLKAILNLQKRLGGSIKIMGKDLKEVQKKIAYIPQTSSINWSFPTTAIDVVLMGRYVHLGWIKRPRAIDKSIALNALKKMGMEEFKNRQISQLSGGQRQRVFIARAIAQDADIYFMDEPLAGVDKITEKVIIGFLKEAQDAGKTTIVVHHDLNTIKEYFDHVVILNKHIIAAGAVEEVFTDENITKSYNVVEATDQIIKENENVGERNV